jgi:hypothetical protein
VKQIQSRKLFDHTTLVMYLSTRSPSYESDWTSNITRPVQWETGKVVLKIACTTDTIVCRECEGGDLELPIDGVGTPVARIGSWGTVRQDGSALPTVH